MEEAGVEVEVEEKVRVEEAGVEVEVEVRVEATATGGHRCKRSRLCYA